MKNAFIGATMFAGSLAGIVHLVNFMRFGYMDYNLIIVNQILAVIFLFMNSVYYFRKDRRG